MAIGEYQTASQLPASEIIADIGRHALAHGQQLGELTDMQKLVLYHGSFGLRADDVVEAIRAGGEDVAGKREVEETRDELIEKFTVPHKIANFASAVSQAIEVDYLPIDVKDDPEVVGSLNERDLFIIGSFRDGKSSSQVKMALVRFFPVYKRAYKKDAKKYLAEVFDKTQSSGRTHLVRVSYEYDLDVPPIPKY